MSASPVCVDPSFVIRLLESETEESPPLRKWKEWHEKERPIVAPALLFYEVANALYRYAVLGHLCFEQARKALEVALELGISLQDDSELHLRAVELAQELSLPAAYDAYYLALAERLGAEFWTADKKLVRKVRKKLPFVRLLEV